MRQKNVVRIDRDLKEIVPGYLQNRKKELSELKTLLSSNSFDQIAKIGHKLRGNAGGYGFEGLGRLADLLEKHAKEKNTSLIADDLESIESYLENIVVAYVEEGAA